MTKEDALRHEARRLVSELGCIAKAFRYVVESYQAGELSRGEALLLCHRLGLDIHPNEVPLLFPGYDEHEDNACNKSNLISNKPAKA